ncbi:MAG: VapC toxin family PIN domain ribonuclease [Nitrospiraceae bacterium]
MFLLDTNIFLELLLDQEKADEVQRLLQVKPREERHLSEFSLYSVGIVLFRCKQPETFVRFVNDVIVTGGVRLLRLSVQDMAKVTTTAQRFKLDFDDAYQYVVAEKHALQIISFDADLNERKRAARHLIKWGSDLCT